MIIKRRRTKHYAVVPNEVLEDRRLSIEARGMLAYLLSRPNDWQTRLSHLRSEFGCGKERVERMMRELLDAGYATRELAHEADGTLAGYDYTITDDPASEPQAENPTTAEPQAGNPAAALPSAGNPTTDLVRTPTKDGDQQTERERAREVEQKPTPAEALETLRASWPDFALESQGLALAALSALTAIERQQAVARVPDFVVFHREKRGKAKLPYLHNYLAEKARWQDIPERPVKAAESDDQGALPAFSRAWWWAFIRYVDQHHLALADPRSGESGWLARRVSSALRFAGRWPVEPSKREAIEKAAEEGLSKHPKDSDHARAWRAYFRTLGVDMPIPDQAGWVWLPSTDPPDTARASEISERDMATEGV